jgi:hypothetical protein
LNVADGEDVYGWPIERQCVVSVAQVVLWLSRHSHNK